MTKCLLASQSMAPAVEMDAVSVGRASAKLLRFLAAESGGVHVAREYASALTMLNSTRNS